MNWCVVCVYEKGGGAEAHLQSYTAMHTLSVKKGYWPYGEGVHLFGCFMLLCFYHVQVSQSTGTTSQF